MRKRSYFLVLVLLFSAAVAFAAGQQDAAEVAEEFVPEFDRPHPYHMVDAQVDSYQEAPMLTAMVESGEIPSVDQRLPENPVVMAVLEKIGTYGGTIRGQWLERVHDWDPTGTWTSTNIVKRVFQDTGDMEPDLAESWEVSSDDRVYTFHLREGLKWSDGEPFTTADIEFWWDDVINNDELTPSKPRQFMSGDRLAELEIVDETTFRFQFAEPVPFFLLNITANYNIDLLNMVNHPAHYMRQFHKDYVSASRLQEMLDESSLPSWVDLYTRESEAHTAGAERPWMTAWAPDGPADADGYWTWSRNPYYYKVDEEGNQLPYIDNLTFELQSDVQTIVLNAIAGQYDFVHIWVRANSMPVLVDAEREPDSKIRVIRNVNAKAGEISFFINQTTPDPVLREIFQDVRFRQAVSLSIDREEVSVARFRGFSEPSQAAFPPQDPYVFDPEWFQAYTDHDPDRANELLDEMGLTERDSDGFRLRPDGERLTIILDYRAGNHTAAIELMPEYLEAIGIELIVKPSASGLVGQKVATNDYHWVGESYYPNFYAADRLIMEGGTRNWGVEWREWIETDGAAGTRPSADVILLYEIYDRILSAQTLEERIELVSQAGDLHKKNLWVIGLGGNDVRPTIVNRNLRNIPYDPPVPYGIAEGFPKASGNYNEQFYYENQ